MHNPFVVQGYESPNYFCDRLNETETLISAIENQRHMTLLSHRRMGKTGLIHHVFHLLRHQAAYKLIYVDLLPSLNLNDMIKILSQAILAAHANRQGFLERLLHLLSRVRPRLSYDTMTGQPLLDLDIASPQDAEQTLEGLLAYLNSCTQTVVLAIDEFQQILQYPEKNIESLLRACLQRYRNIQLIYSGSQRNILISMFQDQRRPFYQSTQILSLEAIDKALYHKFIQKMFISGNRDITDDAIEQILNWTRGHTYYVQYLCNRLYSMGSNPVSIETVNQMAVQILNENALIYNNYKNLLTGQQFRLCMAIAKESRVAQPTSKAFIFRHQLGAASSVKVTMNALVKKEIAATSDSGYFILDVFFSRWLERL